MSDHEIVWTFDSPMVRAGARCNASPDAPCRMMPRCNCEEWAEERLDEQGFYHTTGEDGNFEVHRHDKPGDCNICLWLNESDVLECGSFSSILELAVTPINPIWVSPGYDWEPAK